MNENLEIEKQIKVEQQNQEELNSSLPSVDSNIKIEPVDCHMNVNKCCSHSKEVEQIKLECNLLVQSLLRRKLAEIKRLEDEKKELLENEKKKLNEIDSLKKKISDLTVPCENTQLENESAIDMVG